MLLLCINFFDWFQSLLIVFTECPPSIKTIPSSVFQFEAITTEFEMSEMVKHIDDTSKVWAPEMKKRGLKRFVCTRIWNKGDTFKLGILFEYDTKEAFEANVEYLDKHFNTLPKTKELMTMAKIEGSRGISVFEV